MADPRLVAVGNLLAVLDGSSLDDVLADMPLSLAERDRALAAELSYGVCRWYRRLDALTGMLLHKPFKSKDRDLRTLLLVGAYQLLYSRVPPHAALSTTVEGARGLGKGWASRLVNGVLRRLQRESDVLAARVDADPALRYALPNWLYRAICDAWPAQHLSVLEGLQQRPVMTLRVDLRRVEREVYLRRLAAVGIAARAHPKVASAVLLAKPVAVSRLPGFDNGEISVQDAGAQLTGALLDLQPGQRVLDACAAPGGKTLEVLQRAPDLDLTALDIDPARLKRVNDNLARASCRAEILVGDASEPGESEWGKRRYDRILVDAPCSATGVLRRHPDIRLLRRASDVAALARCQAAILDAVWPLLAPGGRLLYVTCSLLPEENAWQIDAFRERHPEARVLDLPTAPGIPSGGGVQLLPGVDETDGFYYAALLRADAS